MKLKEFTVLVLISLYWGPARCCYVINNYNPNNDYNDNNGKQGSIENSSTPSLWDLKDKSGMSIHKLLNLYTWISLNLYTWQELGVKYPKWLLIVWQFVLPLTLQMRQIMLLMPLLLLETPVKPALTTTKVNTVLSVLSIKFNRLLIKTIYLLGNDYSLGDIAKKLCGDSEISNQNPFCKAIPGN